MTAKDVGALIVITVFTTVLTEWTKFAIGTLPGQRPIFDWVA